MTIETKWVNATLTTVAYLPKDFQEDGANVVLENAYINESLPQPKKSLVMLYGFNGIRRGLVKAFAANNDDNTNVHTINVKAPFEMVDEHRVTLSELKVSQIFHLKKTDKGLSALVTLYFERFIAQNNRKLEPVNSIRSLVMAIAKNPDFYDYLIEQKEFKHLHVIIGPVEEEDGELLSRAFIYKGERIKARSISCDTLVHANLLLPDRVTNSSI